jgi:hypothetical protein
MYAIVHCNHLRSNLGTAVFIHFVAVARNKCKNMHVSFVMFVSLSIYLHTVTQELLNRSLLNFVLRNFTNICQYISNVVKIREQVRDTLHENPTALDENEIHILCPVYFFHESYSFQYN